ncbi:MAG: hypothetical protein K2G90_01520 [Muribaculaceae bacterium]|nr:hypothetical protein [Muribaculaceae bacterium]
MNTEISSEAIRRLMNLFPVVLSFLLLSCSTREATRALDKAESMMESHPDSSLMFLGMMDKSLLDSESARARYALLMSMALDKNYVDTTKFDVLQPAIDYYLKKGSPDEKLRTYYYQGRIFQNQKDYDKAMNSFLKGIDISSECKDSLTLARTLVAQACIYQEFYDFEFYIRSYLRAAGIFQAMNCMNYQFECLLNALNGAIVLNDKTKADSIIKLCEHFDVRDDHQRMRLHEYTLSYVTEFGTQNEIKDAVSAISDSVNLNLNAKLNMALAYIKLGNNTGTSNLLDMVSKNGEPYDTIKYQAISVLNYESIGDYKNALSTYKDFSRRLDSINYLRFDQQIQSTIEKHKLEINIQNEVKNKTLILLGGIGGILILGMVVVILILILRRNKDQKNIVIQKSKNTELENERLKSEKVIAYEKSKLTELELKNLKIEREKLTLENKNLQLERDKKFLEAENLAHRVEILENESESLKILLETEKEIPAEVQSAIKIRIEMLNSLLASYITDNEKYEKSYEIWVKELTENTEEFMNSNRLSFQASHPRFIQYFEEHGLTKEEINYVCLYAIGLRGKEVGNYMKKRSHVNTSSAIRKKLGIDKHETNIGIYVRRLLKNL